MPAPILHHYDFSPFAEKIRLVFGLKKLAWHSVIAPSVMPKPDLVALTGGYRHIPVLQIGADVYCDTRRIARELDRRYPTPALLEPATRALATAIEAWAERDLFWPAVRYVSGINAETVDPQLHVDRAAIRGKKAPALERLKVVARRSLAQLRPQIPVVEQMLSDGKPFLLADHASQADLAVYHGLWFLSVFKIDCVGELAAYPLTRAWMSRVAAIGHGTPQGLSPAQALEIAAQGTPGLLGASIHDDSLPPLGSEVAIGPDGYTTDPVTGTLAWVDPLDVAIRRVDTGLGEIMLHFPRIGYTIKEYPGQLPQRITTGGTL